MIALVCGLLCTVLLFADLVTKMFAHATMVNQGEFFLDFIRLKYQPNSGMMLSIFDKNPTAMAVITALTVLMILGIVFLFFTVFRQNPPARVALAVIEAGAIGNFVDRVCLGYVRDFLNVRPFLFFPEYTANVADICILFGAIALIFIILFIGKTAAFPLTKKWREQAKEEEAKRESVRAKKK